MHWCPTVEDLHVNNLSLILFYNTLQPPSLKPIHLPLQASVSSDGVCLLVCFLIYVHLLLFLKAQPCVNPARHAYLLCPVCASELLGWVGLDRKKGDLQS